jgi:predicted RecA/RadA family phage recombinase
MKNYVQKGENLTLAAPYAVTSGGGVKTGLIFGVAAGTAANGATVDLATVGVFDLAKVSTDAFAVGAAVHWDDTAKLCSSTTRGNQKIGVAVVAAANPSGTAAVRLNGTF